MLVGGKLALVVDGEVGVGVLDFRHCGQRDHFPSGGFEEDFLQGIGAFQVGRVDFQNHMVLVVSLVHGGNLPLAEGIVERVVNDLGRNAQARGGIAVHDHVGLQTAALLVAGDILELGDGLEFADEQGAPAVEFVQAGGLQGIDVLAPDTRPPTLMSWLARRINVAPGIPAVFRRSRAMICSAVTFPGRSPRGFRVMNMRPEVAPA